MTKTISNSKILSFNPEWAEFRGFSLLFDNPGESFLPMSKDFLKIQVRSSSSSHNMLTQLYLLFLKCRDKLPKEIQEKLYSLPLHSYHCTFWDGINDDNLHTLGKKPGTQFSLFLRKLPESLPEIHDSLSSLQAFTHLETTNFFLGFRFKQLFLWNNSVLVACIEPRNFEGKKILEYLIQHRDFLSKQFLDKFGSNLGRITNEYYPHISLAYIASPDAAQVIRPYLQDWNNLFHNALKRINIIFSSMHLYGFRNMSDFFRIKERKEEIIFHK